MRRLVLGRVRFEISRKRLEANLPFLRHLVMSSIVVFNRTTRGKSDRIKLNLVNLKGRVISLKNEVAKAVGLQPRDLELIYCGQCLGDDRVLEASGVKSGSTVFALRKHGPPKEATPEPLSDMATHQLVKTLQAALINPAYRTTVDRLLNTPESMSRLIAASPGLDHDPVSIGMLQDQELLSILAYLSNISK
ncbi:hypothetical protein ScPMuIL_018004 [Solemya velum]